MKIKSRKWIILSLFVLVITFTIGLLAGCTTDKDGNGQDDRKESEGTYHISVPGQEAQHYESIRISNVKDDISGTLSGSIFASQSNETYYFWSQEVKMQEFEGNIWYGWVWCTDGVRRRIYFRRTGIGTYVGSGSVSLGVDVAGSGGSAGASWTYLKYNEYGRITYCLYDAYTYTK